MLPPVQSEEPCELDEVLALMTGVLPYIRWQYRAAAQRVFYTYALSGAGDNERTRPLFVAVS